MSDLTDYEREPLDILGCFLALGMGLCGVGAVMTLALLLKWTGAW
jgi:hypothetical protein